jgi:N-acyl-L-homoserine lactone synthetase
VLVMTGPKRGEIRRLPSSDSAQGSQVIPVVLPDAIVAHEAPVASTLEAANERVYEIRALETEAELYDSYRLRYDVYGALGYLQYFNRSKLEIDIYDRSSVPFGAFDTRTGEMIGTLRLITTEPQPHYEALIDNVLAECLDAELDTQAAAPSGLRLPAISCEEIDRELARFNDDHVTVHELSRFIVRPGHRYSHASRALVQLAMAYAMLSGPAVFIAGCLPRHVRLYASYGFATLPNVDLHQFDSVGQLASTIVCRSDMLPPAMQTQVNELLRSMTSGAFDHTHELSRDSRARFCFRGSAPGTARCTDGRSHGVSVSDRHLRPGEPGSGRVAAPTPPAPPTAGA